MLIMVQVEVVGEVDAIEVVADMHVHKLGDKLTREFTRAQDFQAKAYGSSKICELMFPLKMQSLTLSSTPINLNLLE